MKPRSAIIGLVFLVLLAGGGPGSVRAGGGVVIVTVDGMSFINAILPWDPDPQDFYLRTALREIIQEHGLGLDPEDVWGLDWYPQDPVQDSAAAILDLAAMMDRAGRRAVEEGKAFILIGHSWGTFLLNAALGLTTNPDPEANPVLNPIQPPDLIVTLGSPLGIRQLPDLPAERVVESYVDLVRGQAEAELGPIPVASPGGRWVNFWAWGDVVSGPLAGSAWTGDLPVEDLAVDLELEGRQPTAIRRTVPNTFLWHDYISLRSLGPLDNSRLREAVAGLIGEVSDGDGGEDSSSFQRSRPVP